MTDKLNPKDGTIQNITIIHNHFYNFGGRSTTVNNVDKTAHVDQDAQVPENDKNLKLQENLKSNRFLIKIFVWLYILEALSRILSNIREFL